VEGVAARELPQRVISLVVHQTDAARLLGHVFHLAELHCSGRRNHTAAIPVHSLGATEAGLHGKICLASRAHGD